MIIKQILQNKNKQKLICSPKVGHHPQIKEQIFMGKHYSTEFKLQAISFVSEQGMSVRQAAEY